MKKLCILLLAAMLLTACGKPTVIVSGDAAAASASSSSGSSKQSSQEIVPLSGFNGKGLYRFDYTSGANTLPYLAYTDKEAATQVPLCIAPNCRHDTLDCTAVFSTTGIIYSYKDNLIFFSTGSSSGYDSSVSFGVPIEAPSIIITDATGGNRKTLGTLNGEHYFDFPDTVYGDNLLFLTAGGSGKTILNSINMTTGEGKQISKIDLPNGCSYLGVYKNNYVFSTYEFGTDTFTYYIGLLNVDNGTTKIIAETTSPYNPSSDENVSNFFRYYNGNVYQLTTRTQNDMDTLSSINCETGEISVLCNDIVNESTSPSLGYQSINAIFNDVVIIDSPQSGEDKSLPIFRQFTYNLTTGEKGELLLLTNDPLKGNTFPLVVFAEMGDDLIVETNYDKITKITNSTDGSPYEIETRNITYSIISRSDYLSNTPNFTPITKTDVG